MVSFSYTKPNMYPKLEEQFSTLGANWTVSNGTYAYVSGGELVVKTQNNYSTYHRHWAKNSILFGNMKARFKITGWTNPAKARFQQNVTMYPLPDDVNRIFYCESPTSPVVSGTLVVHSDTSTYIEGYDYDVLDYSLGKIQFRYPVPHTWIVKADWERFDYYCIYSWRFRAVSDTQCYALVFDFWRKKIRIIRFNGTDNAYEITSDIASVDMNESMPGSGVRWIEIYTEEQQQSINAIRVKIYTNANYTTLETSIEAAIIGSPKWIDKGYTAFSSEGKNPAYAEIHIDDYFVYESFTGRDGTIIAPDELKKARVVLASPFVKAIKTISGEIFLDNFVSTKAQWTLQNATISNGLLKLTPGIGTTAFALNSTVLTNFIYDGKVTIAIIGSGSSEFDVRFRRVNDNNEYALSFLTNTGYFKLRKLINGIWTDIDSLSYTFSNGDVFFWRIECIGNIIRVNIWNSSKNLLWNTIKQDSQYSAGNFRLTGYDTGYFEVDKIAIYSSYNLHIPPAIRYLNMKIYNRDTSALIETVIAPGDIGINMSDITKYEFLNLNLYIEIYDVDMSYMFTMTDVSNVLGGDMYLFFETMIPLSIAANIYHVVIADFGNKGKILSVPIVATLTKYDFPGKGIVISSLGNIGIIYPDKLNRATSITQIRARTSFVEFGSIGKIVIILESVKATGPRLPGIIQEISGYVIDTNNNIIKNAVKLIIASTENSQLNQISGVNPVTGFYQTSIREAIFNKRFLMVQTTKLVTLEGAGEPAIIDGTQKLPVPLNLMFNCPIPNCDFNITRKRT